MHMPGAAADGAIVDPAGLAELAWQRLQPQGWPLPLGAFPTEAALVGGAVRDALLDRLRPQPDLDLVVSGDAVQLCKSLSRRHGGSVVVLDAERSIARLVVGGWSIDLARQEGHSLEADLHRRDYTINAMALPLAERTRLVDPLRGARDLTAGLLVAVAETNLLDDPLRLLRGLRLSAELDFQLAPETETWIAQHHSALAGVAGERVLAELEKLAAASSGHQQLGLCLELNLLTPWRGQVQPSDQLLLSRSTAQAAQELGLNGSEQAWALPLARLAAALNGTALQQLHSSRKLKHRVITLRHWQQRLGASNPAQAAEALPESERLQLHRELEDDLPALLLSWHASQGRPWLLRWRDLEDRLFHPRPAIDGLSLQRAFELKASPQLGALLLHLMQEQAFGRLHNRSDALHLAQNWLALTEEAGGRAPRCD
jgi:tRNA nucleotidyltransferase (CCA-adding enzyme)